MMRKIIHIDMDAFFASVEQRDNPEWRGKPLVVGGRPDQRGVVAAASYEARKFGIHSAMPMSRAVRLCPYLIIARSSMAKYREVSKQVMAIYKQYTDIIEPLSVDECFLDVTENKKNIPYATTIARSLKTQIKQKLNLTASAGVAPNKFLAKIASDLQKPDGLTVVQPHEVVKFLSDLPVKRIWGVGKATEKRMKEMQIDTIGDLAKFSEEELSSKFGKSGSLFYRLARGQDDRPVQQFLQRKSISQERTFARDVTDIGELMQSIEKQVSLVTKVLREKSMLCSTVTLKVRYFDFTTITRSHTIQFPFDSAEIIVETAEKLIKDTKAGQTPVRLIGIGVSNLLETEKIRQMFLFDPHGDSVF